MFAAGLAEPLKKRLVKGVQEQDAAVQAEALQLRQDLREPFEVGSEISCVDTHRGHGIALGRRLQYLYGKGWQQADRQIVDTIQPKVLQRMQRNAFARPRQPADYDELHPRPLSRIR